MAIIWLIGALKAMFIDKTIVLVLSIWSLFQRSYYCQHLLCILCT